MGKILFGKKKSGSMILCLSLCFTFLISPVYALGSLRVEKITSVINEPQLKYHIVYPRISGLKDNDMQHRLNVAFMENAETVRAQAEYEAKNAVVNGSVGFEVKRNQNGIMSLVLKENKNVGSSANNGQVGVTINTVTGNRYIISDLFTENADYVATLSAQIKTRIYSDKLNFKQVKEFKEISENASYYLTDKALVIFFRQGEYFANECGVKEFAIPLKSLDGILKPQFIIGSCADSNYSIFTKDREG
jgi:inhibitor of cysteine peptidase